MDWMRPMTEEKKSFVAPEIDLSANPGRLPEVVVYIHADFRGAEYRTNLDVLYFPQDSTFNDSISSIIVVSGTWEFCTDSYYGGQKVVLGPGYYENEGRIGLPNDSISSFRVISL